MNSAIIRKANRGDCPRILALIHELAVYEKAPNEVTVSLEHFEESGFGNNPVWWAFVAELDGVVQGFAKTTFFKMLQRNSNLIRGFFVHSQFVNQC